MRILMAIALTGALTMSAFANPDNSVSHNRSPLSSVTNSQAIFDPSKATMGRSVPGGRPENIIVWPVRLIRALEAHKLPMGRGQSIRICILADGIDTDHPSLRGAIRESIDLTDRRPSLASPDSVLLGTEVALLAAGRFWKGFVGVAPAASIISVKVHHRSFGANPRVVEAGLRHCLDRSEIIHLGFLLHPTPNLDRLLGEAARRGKTVIVPAGNGVGSLREVLNPLALRPAVVAVGSIGLGSLISGFSASDPALDFLAPGEDLILPDVSGSYRVSGTTYSAALLAGVEAIRRSRGSTELRGRLLPGVAPEAQGRGVIDALATALDGK